MPLPKPHIPDFDRIAKRLPVIARVVAYEEVNGFTHEQLQEFKRRIEAQDFKAFIDVPLSAAYLARKKAKGADERVMIATGHYINSLRIFRRRTEKGWKFYAGFELNEPAHNLDGVPQKIRLVEVAAIQEFGSSNGKVPARPHWTPHRKVMEQEADTVREDIRDSVMKQLKAEFPEMR